jgi:hypothetical protein
METPPFTELLVRVRRELNHLYTEAFSPGDAGLFCREHALHLHGIASALGHRSEICTGFLGLRVPGQLTIAMTNTDADHAWCRIDGTAPVDVSLTLRRWPLRRADVALVYGPDPRFLSGIELKYLEACSASRLEHILGESRADLLVYSENAVEQRSAGELHADPFSFLRPPAKGGRTMPEILGDHIIFAITLHCLKLARTEAKPLTYREQWSALRTISSWYPDARHEMESEWSRARSGLRA